MYLCTVPCDMRRSFDGLSMMAEHVIGCNPYAGHLLVLSNRRSDRVKVLYWDRDGWAIWYKRLAARTFEFPFAGTGRKETAAWASRWNRSSAWRSLESSSGRNLRATVRLSLAS
ncbi:hypothetical protein SBA2_590018 [Acidobacteriia bacterium SbA2]|nr:hypothetical protein SBA2_590018 [Acidobacteriia bacterium SbA2]